MAEFWEWFLDDHLYEYIGAYMFLGLALTLFTGIPVAFALGGVSIVFSKAWKKILKREDTYYDE